MSTLKWIKNYFIPIHIFIGIVFLMSGFIVCFLMLLTMIFVWPFDKTLYRKIVYLLAYSHWSQFTFLGQWWSKSEAKLICHNEKDKEFLGKEHTIVIMNHKYDIDWMMVWILSERLGMLGGTKVFSKSTLKFMPLLGWAWFFAESIFLRRDWQKDKETLADNLTNLKEFPDPYWFSILLFCEGTRFTPAKHRLSMQFAEKNNLPILKHHLSPRSKGFITSINGLKGKIPAVFDITLAFTSDSAPPTMMSVLQGKACKAVLYAKRIPLSEIPTDNDAEGSAWLQEHYKYKDDMFDHFDVHGEFPGGTEHKVERRVNDLLMWGFWAIITGIPTAYVLFCFVMYGSLTMQLFTFLLLGLGIFLVLKLVAVSEIKSTSSTYGKDVKSK